MAAVGGVGVFPCPARRDLKQVPSSGRACTPGLSVSQQRMAVEPKPHTPEHFEEPEERTSFRRVRHAAEMPAVSVSALLTVALFMFYLFIVFSI